LLRKLCDGTESVKSLFDKRIIMNGELISKQDCVMRNPVLVFERLPVRTSAWSLLPCKNLRRVLSELILCYPGGTEENSN
jgi:hypothetical protein